MLLLSAALLLGFLVLFKSADWFVIGSVATAKNLDISPMVIGLTLVALGTSAPEIFVAGASSLNGEPELAVGNAIGSNIANIGLVLGVTALLSPLPMRPGIIKNDLPVLIFVTLCAGATLIDLRLGVWDGILLFGALVLFLFRLAMEQNGTGGINGVDYIAEITEVEEIPPMPTTRAMLLVTVSLFLLLISSRFLVWVVAQIAHNMGVSELVIGLTVIAVGTSLPELVVSVTSAMKDQPDLAIGNIVGSNIFNILAVLSIPCVLAPARFEPSLLWRDYGLMLTMTLLLTAFAHISSKGYLTRLEGAFFVLVWISYLVTIYYMSTGTAYQ